MAEPKNGNVYHAFNELVDILLKRGGIPALLIGLGAFIFYFGVLPLGSSSSSNATGFWVGTGIVLLMIVSGIVVFVRYPPPVDTKLEKTLSGFHKEATGIRKALEKIASEYESRRLSRDFEEFETAEAQPRGDGSRRSGDDRPKR